MNLIAELRKRNVFRVVAAYLVASWLIIQVVGFIATATEMPAWVDTFALIVVLLGLPVVVIAAWALELTPDGIKKSGTETELEPRPFGQVDYALVAAIVVVACAVGWQMFAGPGGAGRPMAAAEQIEGTSIAVLPFVAMSGADEDTYLGDGLAEELLNVLAQFPDLMVAGRTSSFAFRDADEGIQAIGDALGVSHILEGSVRRAGEQLRVTAQLIRSSDGFHVWSGTYDRPFEDILGVQDDIVRQIAQVLTVRLGVGAASHGTAQTAVPAAYEQYLQGRYYFAERHVDENRAAATSAFQTAVDIDPDFAEGWGALARAMAYSPSGDDFDAWMARAIRAAERALDLDPNNAEAHAAMVQISLRLTRDWAAAQHHNDQMLANAPNAAFAHYQAGFHYEYMGEVDRAASAFRRAIALDPLNLTIREKAADAFVRMRLFDEARRALDAPGMSQMFVASLERDAAGARGDADGLRAAYEAWDAAVESEGLDMSFLAPIRPHLRTLSIADAEGDVEALPALMDAGFAAADELPFGAEGWRSLMALYAREYRLSAELLTQAQFGAFDEAVYLSLEVLADEFLCQPAYQEVWQREGIPELMEIRRANGATANLPVSGPECEPFLEGEVPPQE